MAASAGFSRAPPDPLPCMQMCGRCAACLTLNLLRLEQKKNYWIGQRERADQNVAACTRTAAADGVIDSLPTVSVARPLPQHHRRARSRTGTRALLRVFVLVGIGLEWVVHDPEEDEDQRCVEDLAGMLARQLIDEGDL